MTRRIVITLIFALAITSNVAAQKYLDRLRTASSGGATVTVTQSKEIDELVNGKPQTATSSSSTTAKTSTSSSKKTSTGSASSSSATSKSSSSTSSTTSSSTSSSSSSTSSTVSTSSAPKADASAKSDVDEGESEGLEEDTYVDTSRKVMRNARKVDGYRVQVYAGGNTRADKNKAYEAGAAMKSSFPDEPIYVHFYTPKWKCLMGNYRSYSDAAVFLKKVKALGYSQACIVKGKITVPY